MFNFLNTQLWLYQEPIDFRKQIDGLLMLVSGKMEKDPLKDGAYIFQNRSCDKIKILIWESNGFWLFYKRLEKGRFKFEKNKLVSVSCN